MKTKTKVKFERMTYASGKGDKLDCCVRSLSIAACIDYEEAHAIFAKHGRKDNHITANKVSTEVLRELFPNAKVLGYPIRPTLRAFVEGNPKGHFIVHVRGHALAVCDGVIHDWSEKPRRKVLKTWKLCD